MIAKIIVAFVRFVLRKLFNLTVEVTAGVKMWTFHCPKCGFRKRGSNRHKIWSASQVHDCEWKKR